MIAPRRIMSGGRAARFPQHYHFVVVTHLLRPREGGREKEEGITTAFFSIQTHSLTHSHTAEGGGAAPGAP